MQNTNTNTNTSTPFRVLATTLAEREQLHRAWEDTGAPPAGLEVLCYLGTRSADVPTAAAVSTSVYRRAREELKWAREENTALRHALEESRAGSKRLHREQGASALAAAVEDLLCVEEQRLTEEIQRGGGESEVALGAALGAVRLAKEWVSTSLTALTED